jgi:hypothetical protein
MTKLTIGIVVCIVICIIIFILRDETYTDWDD